MRFSLQSLAIYLVSTQAALALAGPCRPLTTSSVSATTTIAASEEVSTIATMSDVSTVTSKEETSTTAVGEESTTTMALDLSTTATLAEESTSVTFAETTTILAEATTTTVAEESTTTMAETTTTIAAETTTTASGPTASFYAQYNDRSEVGLYLQSKALSAPQRQARLKRPLPSRLTPPVFTLPVPMARNSMLILSYPLVATTVSCSIRMITYHCIPTFTTLLLAQPTLRTS